MNKSNLDEAKIPKHVGVLMDGNRKWAKSVGLSKKEGHTIGSENLKKIALVCKNMGIKYLTTYAFSVENWNRSDEEVTNLIGVIMNLFSEYSYFSTNNIKVRIIGARKDLNESILSIIEKVEKMTDHCDGMTLTIAFNYGGKEEIVEAFNLILSEIGNNVAYDEITEDIIGKYLQSRDLPDPELIIRTSGVKRLSRFLLWKCSYSELVFVDKYWPEFNEEDMADCILTYQKRERRLGK